MFGLPQLFDQRLRMPLGALVSFAYVKCRRDRVMATRCEFFGQQPPSARALAAAVNQAKDCHDRKWVNNGRISRSPNYAALALRRLNRYYDNSILHRRHGDGEARRR